jgi:hypothetical protein
MILVCVGAGVASNVSLGLPSGASTVGLKTQLPTMKTIALVATQSNVSKAVPLFEKALRKNEPRTPSEIINGVVGNDTFNDRRNSGPDRSIPLAYETR